MAEEKHGHKSKTASVLLAVFLSFWTWLYTYKKDTWKFWVGLGIVVLTVILRIARPDRGWLFLALGIWVWAIIDVSIKKDEWYHSY